MVTFTCPKGHKINFDHNDPEELHHSPTCEACNVVATWYNMKTGEVYNWTDREEYEAGCDTLQRELEAADDQLYFGDDAGW